MSSSTQSSSSSSSSYSASQFHSHAVLRLEEAKQILIDVESMQTVELPRLQQEQSEHHDRIQQAKLELQEIQSQVDQAKQELERLNQAIAAAAAVGAQEVEDNHNSADETQYAVVTIPMVDCSLVEGDDDASKTSTCDHDTATSFDLLDARSMASPSSGSSITSGGAKERRVHRAYNSPKKWRRMIRTRRLQSILLEQ
ncbi:hypothetical protein ACA910_013585 [Epithemia clementina (nom. ined.)]